jgi:exosome complex component RRP4
MKIVVPGEVVSEKPERIPYTSVDNGKTYATVASMIMDDGKLVPLAGPYEPLPEDMIVAVVAEVRFAGYTMDLNCSFYTFLSSRETQSSFSLGDVVFARIKSVDEVKNVELSDTKLLREGRLISVSAVKVPRIIGRKNSMIGMIAEATGCVIYVGRNGYVWISEKGKPTLAVAAIRKIEAEAHISGLTDRIAAFLKENANTIG